MALLFINVFNKGYFATMFSQSSCVCLFMLLFVFILPFFAAVSTEGFWTVYQQYTEQPIITFNNEMIAYISRNDTMFYYSTIDEMNQYATNPLVSPTFKVFFEIEKGN